MPKGSDTAGRPDDPDLAPDAALAEDLGDETQRKRDQLAYLGGEPDDIDDFDPSGLDDGSNLDAAPEPEDRGDEVKEPESKEEDTPDDDEDDDSESAEADEEADSDAADAEDDEEEGEGDEDSDGKAERAQPKGIPKHRFDEVNERRKAAEEELARLKAEREAEEQGAKEEFDFDAKEAEYMDLLLDGKTDEALALRKEIRAAEKASWSSETKAETRSELSQAEAEAEMAALTSQAEEMFPVFNQDHEDFNPQITNKVLAYYTGYLNSGQYTDMGDAFVNALADVVEQYGLDQKYGVSLGDEPAEAAPKPTGKKRSDAKTQAKEEARGKAHQPAAKGSGASADSGVAVPNIMEMSDADLDRLSEEQLARLRGDFV